MLIDATAMVRTKTAPDAGEVPDLTAYDWICVSSSGGKDSQAMLDYVVGLAQTAGVKDRVVVVHSCLGRSEWKGTKELAAAQAAHYGLRFIVTSRIGGVAKVSGKVYSAGEKFGDLLDYVERRKAWPSNKARYCTSEFKRGPILRVFTQLARESRRPVRILDCQGLRAQESPARAKKVQLEERLETSTQKVTTWLPILRWTHDHVWARIKASGVPHHPAYDLGMPRLSCVFCIFSPKAALILAGKHNRELLEAHVQVEKRIGHTFRQDLSLADVATAVDAGLAVDAADLSADWNM